MVASTKRCAAALGVVALVAAICAVTSGQAHTSVPTRTRVTIVTPFQASGRILPGLHLQRVASSCRPDSGVATAISVMNTYSCILPGTRSDPCPKGCSTDPCWRVPGDEPLTMICLGGPQFSLPGGANYLIRVTNKPPKSIGSRDPLDSQPWAYDLSNGESCGAFYPDTSFPPRHPPILSYDCSQGITLIYPAGPINRTKPVWTIRAAATLAQADDNKYPLRVSITQAWFIGRGPSG